MKIDQEKEELLESGVCLVWKVMKKRCRSWRSGEVVE